MSLSPNCAHQVCDITFYLPVEKSVRTVRLSALRYFSSSLTQRFLTSRCNVGGVLRPESWPVEHPADTYPGGSQRPGLCCFGWQHLPRWWLQLEHGIFLHIGLDYFRQDHLDFTFFFRKFCIFAAMNKCHEKTKTKKYKILFLGTVVFIKCSSSRN